MSDPTRFSLSDGMDLAGVGLEELWRRYVALGGFADSAAIERCVILGVERCDPGEHDVIAQALNEAFLDLGCDTFPVAYSSQPSAERSFVSRTAPTSTARSLAARRDAAAARLRSAAAARRSVELHAKAASLMQAAGQIEFARHAETRARAARRRVAAA